MSSGGVEPDGVDWLDTNPPPGRRRVSKASAIAVLIVLVAAVCVIAARAHDAQTGAGAPSPTPLVGPPARPRPPERTEDSTASTSTVVTRRVSALRPYAGWEVFARSSDTVFRLEPGKGRITATGGVVVTSASPVAFLAGPREVLVRPLDDVPGFAVPDGRVARVLTGRLGDGAVVLPGPPDRLWVGTSAGSVATMTLVDFDGEPTGTVVQAPGGLFSDGGGGLLMADVSGVWEVRPDLAPRRITIGTVVATGPHDYLFVECDDQHRCSTYSYDKATRRRQRLGGARTNDLPNGVISPDGRYAALTRWNSGGGVTLSVEDLQSGRVIAAEQRSPNDPYGSGGEMVFSADSRQLIGLSGGRISILDLRTGRIDVPDLGLPDLIQITARSDG